MDFIFSLSSYYNVFSFISNFIHQRRTTRSHAKQTESSYWILDGGKNGVWMRDNSRIRGEYVIYFSEAAQRLLWLPAHSFPGIPADSMNVAALYEDVLKQKLSWFYSQVD